MTDLPQNIAFALSQIGLDAGIASGWAEHEARLYRLWLLCEEAAKTLKKARENLE